MSAGKKSYKVFWRESFRLGLRMLSMWNFEIFQSWNYFNFAPTIGNWFGKETTLTKFWFLSKHSQQLAYQVYSVKGSWLVAIAMISIINHDTIMMVRWQNEKPRPHLFLLPISSATNFSVVVDGPGVSKRSYYFCGVGWSSDLNFL